MQKQGLGVGITGMGLYLPVEERANDWWPESFRSSHAALADEDIVTSADRAAARSARGVDPEIARHSASVAGDVFRGTRTRRVIADDQESSDMEVSAARAALADAGLEVGEVELLIIFSQIDDLAGPRNHIIVADRLGLDPRATAVTMIADCASFVPQLRFACRMIEAGEYGNALLIQSSALSRVTDFRMPSSVNVGDGAVASVVARLEPGHGYVAAAQQTRADLHGGLHLIPVAAKRERWYRGDLHRSRLIVQPVDRRALLEMGVKGATFCRELCQPLLRDAGYEARDVDFFAVTQPTAWFGLACCDALGIDHDRTLSTFARVGHLMSGSLPLNLYTAYKRGRLQRGDLVLLYSPGAGLIQGAMLYRWCPPRDLAPSTAPAA